MTTTARDELVGRLREEYSADYDQGRRDAAHDRVAGGGLRPVIARRRCVESAARAVDPQCWKPATVAGAAAFWLGYADEMEFGR